MTLPASALPTPSGSTCHLVMDEDGLQHESLFYEAT